MDPHLFESIRLSAPSFSYYFKTKGSSICNGLFALAGAYPDVVAAGSQTMPTRSRNGADCLRRECCEEHCSKHGRAVVQTEISSSGSWCRSCQYILGLSRCEGASSKLYTDRKSAQNKGEDIWTTAPLTPGQRFSSLMSRGTEVLEMKPRAFFVSRPLAGKQNHLPRRWSSRYCSNANEAL
jgi:hypothetical protein